MGLQVCFIYKMNLGVGLKSLVKVMVQDKGSGRAWRAITLCTSVCQGAPMEYSFL